MKFAQDLRFNPYYLRCLTLVAIAFSLMSCSSKPAECTKLIGMVSEGQTLIINLSPKLDATTTTQLSQELNMISKEIETLTFKDKPLQTFQKNSTQQFKNLSKTLQQLGEALTTAEKSSITPEGKQQLLKAQKTAQEAGEKAKQIATQNKVLIQELINYCPKKEG